jgi:origin recognition complex subunit 3
MSHYYANPLSILLGSLESHEVVDSLQAEHLEAIRMLPSFRIRIEGLLSEGHTGRTRDLLDSDVALRSEVFSTLRNRKGPIIRIVMAMDILATVGAGRTSPVDRMELYVKAFSGQLGELETLKKILGSIHTFSPNDVVSLIEVLLFELEKGNVHHSSVELAQFHKDFGKEISRVKSAVQDLMEDAEAAGTPIRSKYAMQSKIIRTTVVAQKVQLSKEKSALSQLDVTYSDLLDDLTGLLDDYFRLESPLDMFLNEIWLYDLKSPNREVFTPRPRYAIERALSVPHDYLGCTCCRASEEGLSASQPPTAIIYQLYLETGGLINVFDLWSAFFAIVGGDKGEDCDERNALVMFYRALADLKLLCMVKQSRKKTDHLAKLAWKGL